MFLIFLNKEQKEKILDIYVDFFKKSSLTELKRVVKLDFPADYHRIIRDVLKKNMV